MPQEAADVRVIVTSPATATHDNQFSPAECPNPEEILFVAFCKTHEIREDLVERLRQAAKMAVAEPGPDQAAALSAEYRSAWESGAMDAALVAAVRWWTQVQRKPYHSYKLKTEVGPYRTSLLVAFDEPDTLTMRFNVARAVDILERERTRVMDFFGWEGSTEGF